MPGVGTKPERQAAPQWTEVDVTREDLAIYIVDMSRELAKLADQGGWHIAAESLRRASTHMRKQVNGTVAGERKEGQAKRSAREH